MEYIYIVFDVLINGRMVELSWVDIPNGRYL